MTRGIVILSTLVLSVLFKLYYIYGKTLFETGQDPAPVKFLFSERTLNRESYVYFLMEHISAIMIAACLKGIIPETLFKAFLGILIADLIHFVLFFRDEGVGFNFIKFIIFAAALTWTHLKQSGKI